MANVFNDQKKFMVACGQTADVTNTAQFNMYVDLINEEITELMDALAAKDSVETLDALIDILVVTVGALHSMGVDATGAWKEVMSTNFAKIDKDTGFVRRREDGKILKPTNWQPPQLAQFITHSGAACS